MHRLAAWAKALKREALTLAIAIRDPRTPWHAKLIGGLVIAYALSPIDLIPDFIPVLGLLDDLLLVPIGIALAIKLVPRKAIEAAREEVDTADVSKLRRWGQILVVAAWSLALLLISAYLLRRKT